jgi:hypothetical protein
MLTRKEHVQPFSENQDNKSFAMEDSFMKSYLNILPQPDEMSNLVFWQRDVLNEVDSENVKFAYSR